MSPSAPTVFGKRKIPPRHPPARVDPVVDQAAFFAAARAELTDADAMAAVKVPRTYTAASLAGLVVGCALAGFDVTGSEGASRVAAVAGFMGTQVDMDRMLPALILLGLLGGARAAALTMMVVHHLLDKTGRTDHAAYTLGGAAAAAALAVVFWVVGHPPAHGWAIEIASGAGAGLLYRVFAGTRLAG